MKITRTFHLIRRNPLGFLLASAISLPIVFFILLELARLPISIYSLTSIKEIIADASGVAPEIERFNMNIATGECKFYGVKIFNSQNFDPQNYKSENLPVKKTKIEMLELNNVAIKFAPLSIFLSKPKVEELHIEFESINAIRMTPKMFNILLFMNKLSERFSTKGGTLDKLSIKINKNKDDNANVSYLDFSSSKDIINVEKNEEFSFEQNTPEDVQKTMKALSEAINKRTSMFFFSKAINTFIE